MIISGSITIDTRGRSLLDWDISDAEEQYRIIDVRDWETVAITGIDASVSPAWDDSVSISWTAFNGPVGGSYLTAIDNTAPSFSASIIEVPYLLIEPTGATPDSGTKVSLHVYVTKGAAGLWI